MVTSRVQPVSGSKMNCFVQLTKVYNNSLTTKTISHKHCAMTLLLAIDGFHGGVASLPEGKGRGLCFVQLCAKYRLVSTTLSPYH